MRKITKKYFFSVEGYTELWYLDWLKTKINESADATHKVSFDSKIEKNPLSRMKSLTIVEKTEIWHLCDYESNSEEHQHLFLNTMNQMKEAMRFGREVTYQLGYCNFTFDLWIILHMKNCSRPFTDRKNYLSEINKAFGEHFMNMDAYKRKENFQKCLNKMNISNVIDAVNRAKAITKSNQENNTLYEQNGFTYYKDNPSLSIWIIIEKILNDCGLM